MQKNYRKSYGATKKRIHNAIFTEKLILLNGKVKALVFKEPVQLNLQISEGFRMS